MSEPALAALVLSIAANNCWNRINVITPQVPSTLRITALPEGTA